MNRVVLVTALMSLDTRLRLARLHLITDVRESSRDFGDFVSAAFAGGVDVIQIRDTKADDDALASALEQAREIAYASNGLVVIGNAPDVASRSKADALHLGAASGMTPRQGRRYLHKWGLLGQSVHDTADLGRALKSTGVNYLFVGPVFGTVQGAETPGLAFVTAAARKVPASKPDGVPWFAVGGVTLDNLSDVLAAGARRVAVSAAVTRASDPQAAAQALRDVLDEAWASDEMRAYVEAQIPPATATLHPSEHAQGEQAQGEPAQHEQAEGEQAQHEQAQHEQAEEGEHQQGEAGELSL